MPNAGSANHSNPAEPETRSSTGKSSRRGSSDSCKSSIRALVPATIAAQLAAFRAKRLQGADGSKKNFLSFSMIRKDLAATPVPTPGKSQHNSARSSFAGTSGRKSARATGTPVSSQKGLASLFSGWGADAENDGSSANLSAISMETNKKIRTQIFKQGVLTNKFRGSASAEHAEAQFYLYVTQYQLHRVRKRLVKFALLFVALATPDPVISGRGGAFIGVRVCIPSGMMLLAALLCHLRPRWWRWYIMVAAVTSYAAIISADWTDSSVSEWTVCQKDYNSMWQLIWFLVVIQVSWLYLLLLLATCTYLYLLVLLATCYLLLATCYLPLATYHSLHTTRYSLLTRPPRSSSRSTWCTSAPPSACSGSPSSSARFCSMHAGGMSHTKVHPTSPMARYRPPTIPDPPDPCPLDPLSHGSPSPRSLDTCPPDPCPMHPCPMDLWLLDPCALDPCASDPCPTDPCPTDPLPHGSLPHGSQARSTCATCGQRR